MIAFALLAVACLCFAAGAVWEACRRHGSLDLADEANRLTRYLGRQTVERARLAEALNDAEARARLREHAYAAACHDLAALRDWLAAERNR